MGLESRRWRRRGGGGSVFPVVFSKPPHSKMLIIADLDVV